MSNMTILLSSRCMSCLHLRAWSGHAELGAGQASRARLAVAVTTRRRKSGANSTCSRARADRSAQQDVGDTDGHATWPWFATVVPSRSASSQHPRQAMLEVQPALATSRRVHAPFAELEPPGHCRFGDGSGRPASLRNAEQRQSRESARRFCEGRRKKGDDGAEAATRQLRVLPCNRLPIASRETIRQYGQAPQRALTPSRTKADP
jgi:hypothetical protein